LLCIVLVKIFHTTEIEYIAHLQMESGAMEMVNYYEPKPINLSDTPAESKLQLPTFTSIPQFGSLPLGNSPDPIITIAVDTVGGAPVLYVDKNNNEDLTDDEDPAWDEDTPAFRQKEVLINVEYFDGDEEHLVPYPVIFYQHKTKLPQTIIAYRNGYRKGQVALQDTTLKIAILDDDLDGQFHQLQNGALIVDFNQDDILDGTLDSQEHLALTEPFSFAGQTYRVRRISRSGHEIIFIKVDTSVYRQEGLGIDSRAPAFRIETLNGKIIDLTAYKNRVVLIDFWASWCKPWQENLGSLQNTYKQYHKNGFEIIGLNLDYDIKSIPQYIKTHHISWPQIGNGLGWDMPLVEIYGVRQLPQNYLVDRNGIIRSKNLQGKNLKRKVRELLNESKAE